MEKKSRSRAVAPPCRRVFGEGLLGFAFGYLILHAVAMEVVRWLEPGAVAGASGSPPTLETLFQAMTSVFRPEMVPMGLIFGGLSGVLAGANGAYRLALGAQRDLLARQLDATERYRAELQQALERVRAQNLRLAQLEQARRHTTRFMVHDFKTHLGCIIGFSELLLRAPGDSRLPEATDALGHIHLQGRRMLNAVTDLLDLERLRDAGELSRRAVAPSDLLHEAAEDLALSVERGNVALGSVYGDCPPVLGDPRLLVRVLANLAVNAVKHNPPGTRAVLDAALGAGEAAVVVFSCRDDGRGIPSALLGTIFDEFRTEDADGMRGSSGLGLAFCKVAVEAHGGRIWCETTEGQGASFYFTVPTAEDPGEARLEPPQEKPSRGSPAGAPDSVGRAGRILTAVPDTRALKGELR